VQFNYKIALDLTTLEDKLTEYQLEFLEKLAFEEYQHAWTLPIVKMLLIKIRHLEKQSTS